MKRLHPENRTLGHDGHSGQLKIINYNWVSSVFDKNTEARLEREKRQTRRGLMIFRNYERVRRNRRSYTLSKIIQDEIRDNWERNEFKDFTEKVFQKEDGNAIKCLSLKNYPLTKLSILRRELQMKRDKAWKRYANTFRKKKLIASLNSLKLQMGMKKNPSPCQLIERKERKTIQENLLLEKNKLFGDDKGKIEKQNEEESLEKNTDNEKWLNLMKILEEASQESIIEDPLITEIMQKEETVNKNDTKDEKGKNEDENLKEEESNFSNLKKQTSSPLREGEDNFDFPVEDLDSKASRRMRDSKKGKKKEKEEMPRDTCFYSHPSAIIFKDFEIGKTYHRKVMVCNKSAKWAYLRYDGIVWKTSEQKNLQVEFEGAARLKPGLQVPVTVKFSPEKEEDIIANLIFLTLSPENREDFHIFQIQIHCIPEKPQPLIEPPEVRFPTIPIWKFPEFGHLKSNITISNKGLKPFSFTIVNGPTGESIFWDLWDSDSSNSEYEIMQIQTDDELQEKVPDAFSSQKTGSSIELDSKMVEKKNEEMKNFRVELKPDSKFQLKVKFTPKYIGIHHDAVTIDFGVGEKIFKRDIVPIWGEVNGLNISLDPMFIDLGMIVTDSEIYQQTFNIINTGNTSMAVMIKPPKRLVDQIEVFPKSTIVQAKELILVNVRLLPKENITNQRLGYYDETSNIVTIPIQVKFLSPEAVNVPPLILKILATVTTSHALILKPQVLFLGRVHTQESVVSKICLTNQSLMVQDYGFLNLPHFLEIQPNYGFGKILPGETIKLDLIYSPRVNYFPERNRKSSENRVFQIQAITMAELVGNKILIEKAKAGKQLEIIKKDYREEKPEFLKKLDANPNRILHSRGNDLTMISPEISNFEEENEDWRIKKNIMEIYVQIVDLFCELSEQIIEFPATPCGCFSKSSIQLRGFHCPPNKNKGKKFSATYAFKTSSQFIKVSPQKGFLNSGDIVKVNFIFAPELPNHLALKKVEESKAKIIEKEFKKTKEEIAKKPKKEAKGKKDKNQLVEKTFEQKEKMEIVSHEILSEEINPLENFESQVFTSIVTCNVKIERKNGVIHDQILFAKLQCPVVKPDILILNNSREFDFGPTAVGTTERKILYAKNISNRKLKIDATLLNPFGPFFMPPGQFVEPGSILTLPITFSPNAEEEQVQEFFEIRAVGTLTMWRMAVSGSSVVPNWTIDPKFLVARLEAKPNKSDELNVKIKNTGQCPLTFRMKILDLLEGPISSSTSKNKEDKTKKGKGKKGGVKKFSLQLTEEESEAIYGNQLCPLQNQNVFSFVNFDEKMCVLVRPNDSVDFGIRFNTAKRERESNKEIREEKKVNRSESKMKSEFETNGETIYQIGIFNLSLGNLIHVQDMIVICKTKQ